MVLEDIFLAEDLWQSLTLLPAEKYLRVCLLIKALVGQWSLCPGTVLGIQQE